MKSIFTLLLLFLTLATSWSQRLENATLIETVTSAEISALVGIPIAYDVDLYKMRYYTPDLNGNDHIASGLVCVPVSENLVFPVACYQHGTVNSRSDVPSQLAGGYQLPLLLAALGYVTVAPDFLGLGDSPGIHPYVHADSEAWVALDMLLALREMSESDDYPAVNIHDQLFVGGYSQGGHASMALHRLLEEQYSDEFTVTAAAHMSGPYSISEKMIEFTLGDQEYGTVSYLAWIILAYKEVYKNELKDIAIEDVFKAEYLDDIYKFRDEEITLGTLNSRLSSKLQVNAGGIFPKAMLKEDILDILLNDPEHILSKTLRWNDTYDWAPEAPTNIYYCVGDEQVTFENAIIAEEVMSQNGSTSVRAIQSDGIFPLNHGQCVAPVLTAVNFFFDSYSQLLSSSSELTLIKEIKMIYGMDQIYLEIPNSIAGDEFQMKIYSIEGRELASMQVQKGISVHSVPLPNQGMYVACLFDKKAMVSNLKIFKGR